MARLVIKNGFLKGGSQKAVAHRAYLVKYIATRDGVEKIPSPRANWHSTKSQKELIAQLLREFPDAKESLEYEDYLANPNRENASEFITITLEQHIDKIGDREKYLDYIANRPRVEKFDTHGLFTGSDEPLVLEQVAQEVAEHGGNVWTPIVSLRREDAARLNYDSAESWKTLITGYAEEFAEGMKIRPDQFRWYAAFHNESHHPHIHMICYSTDPAKGFLTKQGIRTIKSGLAGRIFKDDLLHIYQEQTTHRDAAKDAAKETLRELLRQMRVDTLQNEKIEQLLLHLADRLQHTGGKKQYGYLRPELKNVVDEIVDELARDQRVADAYALWQECKGQIENIYTKNTSEPLPLSKCEDFKSIRNMVVKEAMALADGTLTFEDAPAAEISVPEPTTEDDAPAPLMEDTMDGDTAAPPLEDDTPTPSAEDDAPALSTEGDTTEPEQPSQTQNHNGRPDGNGRGGRDGRDGGKSKHPSWWTKEYKLAKQYLHGDEDNNITQDFEQARALLLTEAATDNPLAMCDLGRMYADGLGIEPDADAAYQWYAKALSVFHAAEATKPWKYTEYRIGKMYAAGLDTEQDYETAAHWLTLSANQDYKYAEYSLGGLYYRGNGVEQNHETAFDLYTKAASQDFPYASFELGKMLRDGVGCTKNAADSDRHFHDAFIGFTAMEKQSCDDKLQYRLGWMLLNGIGTEKNIEKAKVYLEKSAAVGNPFACYQLAKIILSDEAATPQEVEEALGYMHQAVEAENPHAQYFLGKLYEKGQHVPQNTAEAMRLYKLSAEQDNDYAAYRLGKLYLGGDGILKDVDEAIRWLNLSADKKNQFAEYALGSLYHKGESVPKDITKAIDFLSRAAAQENQFAQYRLGKIYLTGEDTLKDVKTALRHLTASAEQGNQFAQYTLGKLYLMGKNVEKDRETATKWFTLAAAQGNIYAQFFLGHMDSFKEPSVMLAATRLLHHMSRIIGDTEPARMPPNPLVDTKLRQKIKAKKMAQGHAKDDHEQTMSL